MCYSTIKGNKYTDIQLGVPLDTRHQVLIYHLYYNTDKIHIYLWYSSCSFHVQSYCAVRRSAILSCLHDTHHVLLMYKFVVQFSKEQYSPLIMIQFMKFSSIQSLYSTVNYALFTSYHDGRHEVLFFFLLNTGKILLYSWYRSCSFHEIIPKQKDRRGRDHMVVGFTTTYAISAYHYWCCEFESRSGRDVHYVIKFVSDLRQVGGFLHQ